MFSTDVTRIVRTPFNRTSVELKHEHGEACTRRDRQPLIEPAWN